MENETDVIRNQMLETRTALSEKLEALQDSVVATVQGTTESVSETVQSVKDAVQETVSNVSETVQETVESVKSTLDISKHVEEHPWAMFGGAVALGYVGGSLLPSTSTLAQAASTAAGAGTTAGAGAYSVPQMSGYGSSLSSPAPQSTPNGHTPQGAAHSWFGDLAGKLGPVVQQIEGMAIGTLAGVVGQMVMKSAPEGFRPHLKDMIQQVTTALGGVPVEGLLEDTSRSTPQSSGRSS